MFVVFSNRSGILRDHRRAPSTHRSCTPSSCCPTSQPSTRNRSSCTRSRTSRRSRGRRALILIAEAHLAERQADAGRQRDRRVRYRGGWRTRRPIDCRRRSRSREPGVGSRIPLAVRASTRAGTGRDQSAPGTTGLTPDRPTSSIAADVELGRVTLARTVGTIAELQVADQPRHTHRDRRRLVQRAERCRPRRWRHCRS